MTQGTRVMPQFKMG